MKIATANVAAMTDGGGLAVTVRCEHRPENRWAVHGPDRRRIGTVRPVEGSPAVRPVEGSPADWWALDRDDDVQGRAATFGAALGMVVDAAIDVDTLGGPVPDGRRWAVHGTEFRIAALKRENAALWRANRDLSTAVEEARAAARSARTVLRTAVRRDPGAGPP